MDHSIFVLETTKKVETGDNDRFAYAITEMQGWRISMEDSHAAVLDLDEEQKDRLAFFAVYDGHGGGSVAKFAGQNVHKRLVTEESFLAKEYDMALKRAFLGTDEDIRASPAHARDPSGCTAVAALVTHDKIYVVRTPITRLAVHRDNIIPQANAGDSRSVLSAKGEVKPLSFDHKPTNESEKTRISDAGGYVEYGRVCGNLALSRAIGDFEFKKNNRLPPEKQIITSDPEITVHVIDPEDEFIVLACDGIWDCLTSQQVVNIVRSKVAQGVELKEIGEIICDHCLAPDTQGGAGIGCDNMTILIVALLHGRTTKEWYEWIKQRVESQYGYATPSYLPQIYAQTRLAAYKARREAYEARKAFERSEEYDEQTSLSNFARVLGSNGGISFNRESGILSGASSLMFTGEDSDDDDDIGGGDDSTSSFFTETLGLGAARDEDDDNDDGSDSTQSLKAKLEEFEKGIQQEDGSDDDKDPSHPQLQVEAPPPPAPEANGGPVTPVPQLKSEPGGDKASPAVAAEGLLDTSEDPLKS
ncbi:PP2C-domain-containing protein [Lentinula raphanica]|nr:PP2C-domain-containing protein [Lentinula raphanica]